mgnify:CR=1 FL=1
MTTLVFVHAHPDDESSQTAGSMAMAVDRGYRVVVVYATNGDLGVAPEDLAPGETVADRRHREAEAAAKVIGLQEIYWLGYRDSGMTGWPQNADQRSLWQAPVDEAASRLAAVLDREDPAVVVGYDDHGGYGHPDHRRVHQITYRAAELALRHPDVLEESMNRDAMRRRVEQALAAGTPGADPSQLDLRGDDGQLVGTPEAQLNWRVDLPEQYLARKRAAMSRHASQTSDVGYFLSLPPDQFETWFASEWYRRAGMPGPAVPGWPFPAA